jgi:Tol biopolymer transport system component/tRNA A-37 threonylcarbamoyl transferase component Bud32
VNAPERLTAALADRYRIERELGQGGMATVYLAHDIKHDRQVAIKVLKPELAAVLGADRFVVEIKTTAALQHPHILPLFDSGVADSFLYYVMPFIRGETLRTKLDRETQFGIDDAVRITRDVADALDYAHRNGVIHRDIKPENILLHDGRPMVADFGIALALSAAAGGRMTETGMSLGTPHYMSPEQATADKEITGRSDIYSLGSVLYEMLAGNPPHVGNSAQQIIMKIIAEPVEPVTKYRKSVPANVAAAVAKSLEKIPADRFGSAKEFADALANPGFGFATNATAFSSHGTAWKRRFYGAIGGCAIIAGGWTLATAMARAPKAVVSPMMHVRLSFAPGDSIAVTAFDYTRNGARPSRTAFVFSPDGRSLVYAGQRGGVRQLFLRVLAEESATPIAGTEGGESPVFSPDGTSLGFWADGALRRVAMAGGAPTEIARVGRITGASWSDDGRIAVGVGTRGLIIFSVSGTSPPDTLAEPGATMPQFLPGGKAIVFSKDLGRDLATHQIEVLSLKDGARHVLLQDAADARYVGAGYLIFARRGTLMATRFNATKLATTGSPLVVRDDVMESLNGGNVDVRNGATQFAISSSGQLALLTGGITPDRPAQVLWIDRHGVETPAGSNERAFTAVAISPDGTQFVAAVAGTAPGLQVSDIEGRNSHMLANHGPPGFGLWTSDSKRIARYGTVADTETIVWSPADGSRPPEPVAPVMLRGYPAFWSADGTELFMLASKGVTAVELKTGAARPIPNLQNNARWLTVSPDGKWLAYGASDGATGPAEIYVQPWPALDQKWKVSVGGGQAPAWTKGGRELVYIATVRQGDTARVRRVLALDVGPGPEFVFGTPHELFTAVFGSTTPLRGYDVTADGSRFLVVRYTPLAAPPGEIHVLVNWLGEVKRIMGEGH